MYDCTIDSNAYADCTVMMLGGLGKGGTFIGVGIPDLPFLPMKPCPVHVITY